MTVMFRNLIIIEVARCFPPQCRKLQFDDALDCIFLLVRTGMQWREVRPSTNIGTNFQCLMKGDSTIRSMTEQDLAFHRASQCMELRVSDRRL